MGTSRVVEGSLEAIRQTKRALRKEMAARLNKLDPATIAIQSTKITSHIIRHPAYQKAEKISIYVSMDKGEVKTEDLCRETLNLGKRLYVPRFASAVPSTSTIERNGTVSRFNTDMRMLRIHNWSDFEAMVMNKWGIREPADVMDTANREDALDEGSGGDGLDLILAPGVAFDKNGGRLGHGKGYYDRYIERCTAFEHRRGRDDPIILGLALQEQVLPEPEKVPADGQDRVLDNIITSEGPLMET